MSNRRHTVKVSLDDRELARLHELRNHDGRAVYMRRLLHRPPLDHEIATHGEALAILTRLAREGNSTAAIALVRALRAATTPSRPRTSSSDCSQTTVG